MSTFGAIVPPWVKVHFCIKIRIILGFEILTVPDFSFLLLSLMHEDEGTGSIISMTYTFGYFSNSGAHCKYSVPGSPSTVLISSSSGIFPRHAQFISDWTVICPARKF